MNRWIRSVAAAAVVAVSVAAPARAADIDPLIPAESKQVMRLNIKQILESDIIKKYALNQIKQAMEGADASKALKELGLDPLKDIDTLNAGFWGDDPQNMHGLAILKGKFDPAKLFEAVDKAIKKDGDKVSIVKEGDVKLIKIVMDKVPEPLYASMADDKTILLATDKKIVLEAIKASDAKATKSGVQKELSELVAKMDDKASMYYVGLTGKIGDIPDNPIFEDTVKLKKQLESMESSAMMIRVSGDVAIEAHMNMKDAASADDFGSTIKDLMDKARVFLPLIAMQAPQAKPVVDDLKKSLSSKVDSKQIKVTLKLTGDAIGKAVGADE
ncbi:hypothetical protein BH11PLA2_BH11PLA2_17040 [soil metagenome]